MRVNISASELANEFFFASFPGIHSERIGELWTKLLCYVRAAQETGLAPKMSGFKVPRCCGQTLVCAT